MIRCWPLFAKYRRIIPNARRMAQRDVRGPLALFGKKWRLSAHGERARRQADQPEQRARWASYMRGAPGCRLPSDAESGPPLSPISSGSRALPWKFRGAAAPAQHAGANGGGFATRRRARASATAVNKPVRPTAPICRAQTRRRIDDHIRPLFRRTDRLDAVCVRSWKEPTSPRIAKRNRRRCARTMPCDMAHGGRRRSHVFERWAASRS